MGNPSKSGAPPQSASKSGKRKSAHFEKDSPKLSPNGKKLKSRSNDRAASPPQLTSPVTRPPASSSRGTASGTGPAIDDSWRKVSVVEEMSIVSASSIQKKVTRAVDSIVAHAAPKQVVVEFHAKGPATPKMISVVEIVKRELASRGETWYQYNKVEQVLVERKDEGKNSQDNEKSKEKVGTSTGQDDQNEEDEEEEEAFETMKTPFERANEGTAKVRAVPVMTIYLTHARIEELRKAYGEQTNSAEAPKA